MVVDALDEAVTPGDARLIIRQLLVPLVETCSDVGAQVLVGTRRRDDTGDLIAGFGRAHRDLDLDHPRYFELADLVGYAEATLRLVGDERVANPYADHGATEPLAERIARVAAPNFPHRGTDRPHSPARDEPADPATVAADPHRRRRAGRVPGTPRPAARTGRPGPRSPAAGPAPPTAKRERRAGRGRGASPPGRLS